MRRVLVTGPVERLDAWCDAARAGGWEPIELPLVEIVPRDVKPEELFAHGARFEWLALTSRSALPFVARALASFPALVTQAAAVGDASAERLRELGLALPLPAARDADELAERLVTAGARGPVLWPRGDQSDELARRLRAAGTAVTDPIVYATRPRAPAELPAADAVLFASPSGVRAWCESAAEREQPRLAIAIGRTTLDALLEGSGECFTETLTLSEPTPEAFADALAHL